MIIFRVNYYSNFSVTEACMKTWIKVKEAMVHLEIGEYLKHGPHRPGGANYKVIL